MIKAELVYILAAYLTLIKKSALFCGSRGVATEGTWGSRKPPGSPNTLFGTPRFYKILALALWCWPSQTSDWLPHTPHFPSLPRSQFLVATPLLSAYICM